MIKCYLITHRKSLFALARFYGRASLGGCGVGDVHAFIVYVSWPDLYHLSFNIIAYLEQCKILDDGVVVEVVVVVEIYLILYYDFIFLSIASDWLKFLGLNDLQNLVFNNS